MHIFITGTGTNVGKTTISSWLTLHSNYSYFKPIQTGACEQIDSDIVFKISNCKIYPEIYNYPEPLSPHIAAEKNNEIIDLNKIILPTDKNLLIEGAGGILVPINKNELMIDLIKKLNVPTIIVASNILGTINHSLLTIKVLQEYKIPILGVILTGHENPENKQAIEYFGKTKILAQLPFIDKVSSNNLAKLPLSTELYQLLKD
ncbi:dethiobiotin synthase [Bartonella sp. DGB1]|uniref:dethiobiotin synthase n=1 Tax=Bartonella sp. DGB1 TaxID=3239807 RepID=UPI003523CFE2